MQRPERQILRALLEETQSVWDLLAHQDGYLSQFVDTLDRLVREGLVSVQGDRLALTPQGKARARGEGLVPRQNVTCPACSGRGLVNGELFARVQVEFEDLVRQRPPAVSDFDQGFVSSAAAVARTVLMYLRQDLENRDLLLVGDDDLVSLAAALTGLPRRIQVLEIDPRLVDFINDTARQQGWGHLKARVYDVRQPLPPEFAGAFTTAFTDPVETRPGIRLFLGRSASGLQGPETALYFGLTTLESSPAKRYDIQRLLLDMGFFVSDLLPRYHQYHLDLQESIQKNFPHLKNLPLEPGDPPGTWYTSHLVRAEVVRGPFPPELGEVRMGDEFYFDAEA